MPKPWAEHTKTSELAEKAGRKKPRKVKNTNSCCSAKMPQSVQPIIMAKHKKPARQF